jgi:hypothetical protein
MRSRSLLLSAFAITFFSLLISYLKFARCIPGGWISPDVYQHGCYTDITGLYEVRGFAVDAWPFAAGEKSLEYPILSGIGIWIISLLTKNGSAGLLQFFHWNLFAISLAYGVLVYQLAKLDKQSALLFSFSPAVISALFINWDIWAITPLLIALTLLSRQRYWLSGIALAISISVKFFPIIYVIPVLLSLTGKRAGRISFFKGLIFASLIVNLPFMLFQFDGWAKFYIFNFKRDIDFGSIWYLVSLKGSWISDINWLVTPLVIALLVATYWRYRNNLFGSIFLSSVIFFTLNKVYSPQYVLWLALVAVLYFPKTRTFYGLFAVWQGGELLYQFGIWRHLLTVLNEAGGVSTDTYVNISAFRILSLLALAGYALFLLENDLVKGRRSESNV